MSPGKVSLTGMVEVQTGGRNLVCEDHSRGGDWLSSAA
jgi:hypothetical protein